MKISQKSELGGILQHKVLHYHQFFCLMKFLKTKILIILWYTIFCSYKFFRLVLMINIFISQKLLRFLKVHITEYSRSVTLKTHHVTSTLNSRGVFVGKTFRSLLSNWFLANMWNYLEYNYTHFTIKYYLCTFINLTYMKILTKR